MFFVSVWGLDDAPLMETNVSLVEGEILPRIRVSHPPELPNTYLIKGTNTLPFTESTWRRYDVVFFVAIPISFYLIMNVLMIKNAYFYQQEGAFLSDTDWNYIYLSTFLIPLFAAYYDQVHYRQYQGSFQKFQLTIPLYQTEF
ncbi:hypothetical protein [Thermospira aquatica]|uniref:P-type ATPase C-terminal domain-containing protein n=1 Tax=Thermospira aquatica TaxID=2828656 RepID=A0AAX3BCH3_9SPIR|nr:hypothetical protein [Thermospira aquatica]URA09855.1 hypothetical protein KDW03_10275 [Thermospira aquatica]